MNILQRNISSVGFKITTRKYEHFPIVRKSHFLNNSKFVKQIKLNLVSNLLAGILYMHGNIQTCVYSRNITSIYIYSDQHLLAILC